MVMDIIHFPIEIIHMDIIWIFQECLLNGFPPRRLGEKLGMGLASGCQDGLRLGGWLSSLGWEYFMGDDGWHIMGR